VNASNLDALIAADTLTHGRILSINSTALAEALKVSHDRILACAVLAKQEALRIVFATGPRDPERAPATTIWEAFKDGMHEDDGTIDIARAGVLALFDLRLGGRPVGRMLPPAVQAELIAAFDRAERAAVKRMLEDGLSAPKWEAEMRDWMREIEDNEADEMEEKFQRQASHFDADVSLEKLRRGLSR
jgi:hypothetical protein